MPDVLLANLPYLLRGALITLGLSSVVVALGSLLGFALGVMAATDSRPLRLLTTAYIFFLRGIPVLVVMLLGYYLVPALGATPNAYVAAFAAEIIRGAIASVPAGQVAAARSLGMRRLRMLRAVILPQATRIAIPPLLNNALTAVKQTSYVSVVGVWELSYAAREVVERTLASFQIFLGVMAMYFLICYPLSLLARWSEQRSRMAH